MEKNTSITDLKTDLHNKNAEIGAVDKLINAEKRNYMYNTQVIIAGKKVFVKDYYEPIMTGYNIAHLTGEKEEKAEILTELKYSNKSSWSANAKVVYKTYKKLFGKSAAITHDNLEKAYNLAYDKQEKKRNKKSDYSELSEEEQQLQNKKRSLRRVKSNLKYLLYSNVGNNLSKFLTLTIGDKDYAELIENNCKSKFNQEEIKALEGVKDIRNVNDLLKDKVVKVLGKHLKQFEKAKEKTRYTAKSKLKREVIQLLNNFIFEGDYNNWEDINRAFDKFRRKLNRYNSKDFKYVAVIERQKENEDKKIHFHISCNLDYIDQYKLQKKWGNGFVDIQKITPYSTNKNKNDKPQSQQEVVDYMVKYVSKDVSKDVEADNDKKIKTTDIPSGKQVYRASKGLKRAQKITDEVEIKIIKKVLEIAESEFTFDVRNKEEVNAKDFMFEVLNLNSLAVYNTLRNYRDLYIKKLIKKAKKKSQTYVTSGEVFEIRKKYLSNLSKKINQIIHATDSYKTA